MGYSTRSKSAPPAERSISKTATPSKPAKSAAKAAASADMTPSKAAETFPDVPVLNSKGETIQSASIVAHGPAVVFLYPKANTPGCTKQACGFKDTYKKLQDAGYAVYGLSYDSPKSQTNWAEKYNLPYSFLCDTLNGGLIKALGAHKAPKSVKRSHFVVAKGGVILDSQVQVSPADSVEKAMEFVMSRKAGDSKIDDDSASARGNGDTSKDPEVVEMSDDHGNATGAPTEDGNAKGTDSAKADSNKDECHDAKEEDAGENQGKSSNVDEAGKK